MLGTIYHGLHFHKEELLEPKTEKVPLGNTFSVSQEIHESLRWMGRCCRKGIRNGSSQTCHWVALHKTRLKSLPELAQG